MKRINQNARKLVKKKSFWKWLLIIVGGIFALILILAVAGGIYVQTHKKEVLASVLAQLNENIDGTISVGDLNPEIFANFPRISLNLTDLHLKDREFDRHHKELLSAKSVLLVVNALDLIRGKINIVKIDIRDGAIYLLTDANGYSNASIFAKKKKSETASEGALPELRKFELSNVSFTADNQMRNKLFVYKLNSFKGVADFDSSGWNATATLDGFAENMSFNLKHGSFMEKRKLDGDFSLVYKKEEKQLIIEPRILEIGGEKFTVSALFLLHEKSTPYSITIKNDNILWQNASHLLSKNISVKLDMFAISKPISVTCNLDGDFNDTGNPKIIVKAICRDSNLKTPGGPLAHCSFDGLFTNNKVDGKGYEDENSAIELSNFTAEYGTVPFKMPMFSIDNLSEPIARGKVIADFPLNKLNGLVSSDLILFGKGQATANVEFTSDIYKFKIEKPIIKGLVTVKGGSISYNKRKLKFDNLGVSLDFSQDRLKMNDLSFNIGEDRIKMDGQIDNFLDRLYKNPDNLTGSWNVYSKELHLARILPYLSLSSKTKTKEVKKTGNFTSEFMDLVEKTNFRLAMKIDKLNHKNFTANNVNAIVLVTENDIKLENANFSHAGGTMKFKGRIIPRDNGTDFSFDADANKLDINRFFSEFDNFGMETMTAKNLKGKFTFTADVKGRLGADGSLLPRSMYGNVSFTVNDGALINFDPIVSIGKYAFSNRNVKNITFPVVKGSFKLEGERAKIAPLKVSSNVLNLDIYGTYSFGKGTYMIVDVPLRDPGRDEGITNKEELLKRRKRGIVLHFLASDDAATGKVKIKLTGKKELSDQKADSAK